MLKPGMGTYANATGKPEPVLTAGQWRDISTLAGRGGTPPSVQVFIGDEEVTGRVRVVVRDELGAGARADGRRARMAGVG